MRTRKRKGTRIRAGVVTNSPDGGAEPSANEGTSAEGLVSEDNRACVAWKSMIRQESITALAMSLTETWVARTFRPIKNSCRDLWPCKKVWVMKHKA
jgi:hypothetical protein